VAGQLVVDRGSVTLTSTTSGGVAVACKITGSSSAAIMSAMTKGSRLVARRRVAIPRLDGAAGVALVARNYSPGGPFVCPK
jgi:hypothetical protein